YLRMLICWNVQTCLCHQCQQANGLERHCFTTCVGAGYDYHEKFVSQVKIYRDDFSCQKWVARVAQVYHSHIVQAWFDAARHAPVARFGKMKVKLGQQFDV